MSLQPKEFSEVASMVYAPQWTGHPLVAHAEPAMARSLYLVPHAQAQTMEHIVQWLPDANVLALRSHRTDEVLDRLAALDIDHLVFVSITPWREGVDDEAILAFMRALKALASRPKLRLDIITVNSITSPATQAVTHPVDAVYVGLGQTIAREFTHWQVRSISLTAFTHAHLKAALAARFDAENGVPLVVEVDRYWRGTVGPVLLEPDSAAKGFRVGGTYMIIGANGGIGGVLARRLAQRYRAKLVLVGRRPEADALVRELQALGGDAVYESVDLADAAGVRAMLHRYPQLNGIVHSALALDDASLVNMSEASLMAVLQPKVHGTINLINALHGHELDFVLLFSSIQSYIANAGQANYTAACVGKDALGGLMRDAMMIDARVINWGFWGSIGIVASDVYRERMRKLEIGSIEPEEGLAIIEQLLTSTTEQITVIKASDAALRRLRIEPHPRVQAAPAGVPTSAGSLRADMAWLGHIVPRFDEHAEGVRYNIALSEALQRYAGACLARVPLPEAVADRHAKLAQALKAIPGGTGPTREQLLHDFPELIGHVRLLDKCMEQLPLILTGEVDPLTVMFPEGSFELVEPIYRDNPLADYFNRTVAEVVKAFAGRRGDRPLRVLEIGAGTGSTTQFVLPVLDLHTAQYTFTDLSFAFLNKARRRFAAYPFVRYEIFNVETPPPGDELFDVVIATNVIHATADLPRVLSNVRARVAPGGVFILNEITSCQDYATLTFGLTEGWWLSVDDRIPNSPLVAGETWRRLLLNAGFAETCHHGNRDQQVIVAGVAEADTAGVTPVQPNTASAADRSGASAAPASAAAAVGDRHPAVCKYICSVIAQVMHADEAEIDIDQPFNEYGIDSLIALELLKPFRADLGYLPATVLFEHPTVARLAAHFIAEFGPQLDRVLAPVVAAPREPAVPIAAVAPQPSSSVDAAYAGARDLLRTVIAETMLMGVEQIEDETPFMEYGIDSIISLELLKPLRATFGYLPATLLFEFPSVKRLATHLAQQHPRTAAGLSGSGAPGRVVPEPTAAPAPALDGPAFPNPRPDDIAIVGIAGQFPDADDVDEFWRNLLAGRECKSPLPTQRWSSSAPYAGRSYTAVGGFIRDVDAFDHQFFNITPLEAQRMDPQERLFLQAAYHAIEDAGQVCAQLRSSDTGVFVGVMNGAYAWHRPRDATDPPPSSLFWSIANRTSYLFDLKGPSMAIDTACSSSLTALHLACQALRSGDCRLALVGGVNLIVHPLQYDMLCGMHMLSRSHTCRPFGEGADGFVDGEGVCCVIVKRYEDAVRDNDRIYGVVRGTAINAGGQSNGYSAPNPDAQAKVIARAIDRAGLTPDDIGYVEAHGTGTELGDPIEVRGLASVFADVQPQSVALGSVKGNIGHLESAAGLAGAIKVLLQMQHGTLVPSINAEQENPHLRLANTPFHLQRTVQPVDKLIAGLSSYGAGGANAHAVIQSVPTPVARRTQRTIHVATLSARTDASLQRQIDALHDWLQHREPNAEALAYTLCCARDAHPCRVAYVFETTAELRQLLRRDLRQWHVQAPIAPAMAAVIQAQQAGMWIDRAQAQVLADAFVAHVEVDWNRVYPRREVVSLPGYAFEKHRFWVDSSETGFGDTNELIRQHVINGAAIAPAAWTLSHYLESSGASTLQSVLWRSVIHDLDLVSVQSEGSRFSLRSLDQTRVYCEGEVDHGTAAAIAPVRLLRSGTGTRVDRTHIYNRFAEWGYRYGHDLQPIRWAEVGDASVTALLDVSRDWGYRISPALLDGGLQAAILLPELQRFAQGEQVLVPYHLGRIRVLRAPRTEAVYCHCALNGATGAERSVSFDVTFTDSYGNVLIQMEEMTSLIIGKGQLQAMPAEGIRSRVRSSGELPIAVHDLE